MTTICVLDTSVAIAWYLPEVFSPAAKQWRERMLLGDARFLVPGLHWWEMANVLRTYIRRGELPADLAQDIFRVHTAAPLETMDPPRERVLPIALEYEATAYDAVYIALSLERKLPLLTAERPTTPWVVRLGRQAISIGASQ